MRSLTTTSLEMIWTTAKKAYGSASARTTNQLASAVMHLMNNFQHAFFMFGCVEWERAAYTSCNSSLIALVSIVQRVLLFPYTRSTCNASYTSAMKYFLGTSMRVEKLLPSMWNLIWIWLTCYSYPSIHAFKDLMDNKDDQLCQWIVKNIFIGEYHNIFGELVHQTNSWASLRNLARHDIKITFLLAMADTLLMSFVGHYLKLGNYKLIGELDQYPIPMLSLISNFILMMSNVILMMKCYLYLFNGWNKWILTKNITHSRYTL